MKHEHASHFNTTKITHAYTGDTFYIARYLVSGDDQASLYVEVQEVRGPDVICVAKNSAVLDGLLTVCVAVCCAYVCV